MKTIQLVYSSVLILVFLQGYSQKAKVEAAHKSYDLYAYVDAISTYERLALKGYKDEKMFQNLANAHYFNAELGKALKWYTELFTINQDQEAEYYYRYSQCLKSVGEYNKANEILGQFNLKSGNDRRALLYSKHKNYLEEIKSNSGRYTIEDAGINSKCSDFGSSFSGNKLVFATSRDTGGISKRVFKWNDQSFTNLYASDCDENSVLSEPKPFGNKMNSKYHESTPVFTKDGKTVYFTRNNFLNGKKGKDDKKTILLKIYKATLEKDSWLNIQELPFSSNEYSVAHPVLSPDEKTLYFASDMPGTFGKSDLFKVSINDNGSFGKPENLGEAINTEGRESFPFISGDNKLYFASDGHPGLGGLDIFVTKIDKENNFGEILNVGTPVNSSQDDFAFLINSNSRKGFFTSNRTGGKGLDDIYKLTEISKQVCKQGLEGVITESESEIMLQNAKVSLYNSKFELLKVAETDENGKYSFDVECGKKYYVKAEKEDYMPKETSNVVPFIDGVSSLPIQLEKAGCKIVIGGDLAKCFDIKLIYFDLDKSLITDKAVFELEKILDVLNQSPKMKIDVRSHTDSRSTAKYNESLSDRRAKSTIDWFVKNGIDASRLTGKGYGESQIVNSCVDGVKCTEEEHQANRRSEFIVTSM